MQNTRYRMSTACSTDCWGFGSRQFAEMESGNSRFSLAAGFRFVEKSPAEEEILPSLPHG